jgi:hypothetical protein
MRVCSGIRAGANTEIITRAFIFVTAALKAEIARSVCGEFFYVLSRLLCTGLQRA